MNCLIERVRDVLVKNESETFKDQARAAIAAVAEWIEAEAAYGRERRVSDILKKQLEQPK